jgi:hypothetical protein
LHFVCTVLNKRKAKQYVIDKIITSKDVLMELHETEINQIKNLIIENNQHPYIREQSAFYRNLH